MKRSHVWIHGISGRVGQKLSEQLQDHRVFTLSGGSAQYFEGGPLHGSPVDEKSLGEALKSIDTIFDFSSPDANQLLMNALANAKQTHKSILIGTTQISDAQWTKWKSLAKSSGLRVLVAPNTSIGIFILAEALRLVAPLARKFGFDCEIVETHHNKKVDSPSGTALSLANTMNDSLTKKLPVHTHYKSGRPSESLGIHSIRGGGVFGEHDVRFISENEELRFGHRAMNRTLFADGALTLAGWLDKQPAGFYQLKDIEFNSL